MTRVGTARSLNLTPQRVQVTMDSSLLVDEDFTERLLYVTTGEDGITVALEGGGVGGPSGGSLAELDAEQARHLADALNDAADKIEASGGDDP